MAIIDFDWDAYKSKAADQTDALNYTPGVANPARLTSNSGDNLNYLYGKNTNDGNLMPGAFDHHALETFKAEMQKVLGRAPADGEIQGFLQRLQQGGASANVQNTMHDILMEIGANTTKQGGQDADSPTVSSQAPVGFSGGMLGYPYLPTGQQGGFGGGLMGQSGVPTMNGVPLDGSSFAPTRGGNALGGGYTGYPFTASN